MGTRDDLAEACNQVEGVFAEPYFTGDSSAGRAHIRMERTDYPNPFGGVVRWNVVVMLPADQAQAERWIEAVQPQLIEQLAPHLAVTSAVPQRIEIPNVGPVPALFINGHREES
ncbi:MAG TPA: hypothetical protein VMF51_08395 [Nocardioides sp.]|uniref:hypothetical protein n=1 Tax=Nocardioides sp. TaxID=35761 RepID=UPI002C47E266|nr:hypothetical protein [Nocardioides sp.]HTW15135.1 hypothetical protein [Nocardioides sp.]